MIITTSQVKKIASLGGNLVIDSSFFTVTQIAQIALEVAKSNGSITIKKVTNLTYGQLRKIASLAPGQITFDLS